MLSCQVDLDSSTLHLIQVKTLHFLSFVMEIMLMGELYKSLCDTILQQTGILQKRKVCALFRCLRERIFKEFLVAEIT